MKKGQLHKLQSFLSTKKNIVIVPHRNPDGDAMGSTDCNNNGIDDVCEDEYYLGEDAGYILGTSAGDINLDGNLNVTDIIMYIEKILED